LIGFGIAHAQVRFVDSHWGELYRTAQGLSLAGMSLSQAAPVSIAGDYLPGHEDSFAGLVPRDLVGDDPQERCQRFGTATRVGLEELRDRLDVAA